MKNLFLAFEIKGQWPASFPKARLIPDAYRHLTLAFIGPYDNSSVMNVVPTIPRFKDTISPSGRLDNLIFLPPGIERIAVLIPQFFDMPAVMNYQKEVSGDLLRKLGLQEKRSFLPHVSIARAPFDHKEWKEISWNIPFYVSSLSLYQTVASLRYDILWKQPYTPPFDEIDHTADLAYTIRGRNLSELFSHALLCLSFFFPSFTSYLMSSKNCSSLAQVIFYLNEINSFIDIAEGSEIKAISQHGDIKQLPSNRLEWTMIVDV